MKILYIHQYFATPGIVGSGVRSYEIARRLVEWGHDVEVITSDRARESTGANRVELIDGVRVHWISVPYENEMSNSQRLFAFLRFAVAACRMAYKIDADVIYATSTPLTVIFPALAAKLRRGRPLVFEVRDLWPEMPIAVGAISNPVAIRLARLLERIAYWSADAVVALSPGMAEGVRAVNGSRCPILVSPNASDIDFFSVDATAVQEFRTRNKWLGNSPMLLYAGTFGPINGVDYFVRLACLVAERRPDVRFVAVGGGREKERVAALASDLGLLGSVVHLFDRIPKRDIPLYYGAADMACSLFADVKEMEANSANKFFDGLAAGTPMAINYGGWQADLLVEAGAGVRLSRDVALAADQILSALDDRDWLCSAGSAARALATERFERTALTREIEQLLLSVGWRCVHQ